MYMPYTPYSEAAVRRTRTAGDGGFESSKRSTREDSSKKLHRHRHSIQDPPGSHHHRRPHARSHKHHGIKDAIGSTLPPGFENLAKQGHANADSDHTPSSTAHASRQGSNGQIDMGDLGAARQALVKAEDVEREKWKAKARDE